MARQSKWADELDRVSTFKEFEDAVDAEVDLTDLDGLAGVEMRDDADTVADVLAGRDRALDPRRL